MIDRRALMLSAAAVVLSGRAVAEPAFPFTLSEEAWRARLSPARFQVLRQGASEPPNSSPLTAETRPGLYRCAGCDQPLFRSEDKYPAPAWPTYSRALEGAVVTDLEQRGSRTLTKVSCSRCGGHLGHRFDDGPPPDGKRWCMLGLAMTFEALRP